MRATLSSILGLALLAGASLSAAPAFAQKLSAQEIRQEMLGRTIVTLRFGMKITMRYRPNGTVSAKALLGDIEGTWRAKGDQVCTTFPSGPALGTQCVSFERIGEGRYRNSDGVTFTVQ